MPPSIRPLEQGWPVCSLLWGPELAADFEMGLHKAQCCPEALPGPGSLLLSTFEEQGNPGGRRLGSAPVPPSFSLGQLSLPRSLLREMNSGFLVAAFYLASALALENPSDPGYATAIGCCRCVPRRLPGAWLTWPPPKHANELEQWLECFPQPPPAFFPHTYAVSSHTHYGLALGQHQSVQGKRS